MHLPPRHCPRLGGIPLVACPSFLQEPARREGAEIPEMGLTAIPPVSCSWSKRGWLLSGAQAWQAVSSGGSTGRGMPRALPTQLPTLGQRFAQPVLCEQRGQCRKQEGLRSVLGTEIHGPRGSWLMAALHLCHQQPRGQGDTGTGNTTSPNPSTSIPLSASRLDPCWHITNKHLFISW